MSLMTSHPVDLAANHSQRCQGRQRLENSLRKRAQSVAGEVSFFSGGGRSERIGRSRGGGHSGVSLAVASNILAEVQNIQPTNHMIHTSIVNLKATLVRRSLGRTDGHKPAMYPQHTHTRPDNRTSFAGCIFCSRRLTTVD